MRIATPSDWKTLPLPEERAPIELSRSFSSEEFAKIQRGVIPEEMEDKWFVYWQDDALFFHRSWTGFCIYVVRFSCNAEGATITSADVNRNSDQYSNTDDAHDVKLILYLIDTLLLRKPAPFPAKSPSKTRAAIEQWGVVGQAGLGVHPGDNHEPRFMLKTRCHLCEHKFFSRPGCMAFPTGLPSPLANGSVMHDKPFPGDRGYRFGKRRRGGHAVKNHLWNDDPVTIPLNRIHADAQSCDLSVDQSMHASYSEFVAYLGSAEHITTRELILGASFTYSWMPRVLDIKNQHDLEAVAAYLDAVRLGNDLDAKALAMVKGVVNNSMIGSSKLLHFVNPERYPIIDRWVDTYLYGKPSYDRQNSIEHYLAYACGVRKALENPLATEIHGVVYESIGYEVTPLRALELVMFTSAKEGHE